MKAFLLSLGLVLLTALVFALVAPNFIDWSGYRVAVESRGERLLGRPVEIAGALDVSVLPRPVLRAEAVSLAGSDAGGPAATVRSLELHLDLGALILGELEVSELRLVEPEVAVGQLLSRFAELGRRERAPGRAGALSRIEVRNAILTFDDPLGAGTLTARGVDLQIVASTLAGPFKITGSYGARGEGVVRPEFTGSIGSIDGSAPVRVAGRIGLAVGDVSFDGALNDLTTGPRFSGRLKVERGVGEDGDGQAGRLTAEAVGDLAPGRADFSELRLVAADKAQALTLLGSGRASWDGPPRFSADFKARQIDLDAALGGSRDNALANEIGDIAIELARMVREHEVTGRVEAAVDGAVWRGELTRNLSVALEVKPGVFEINNAQGSLPGETEFSLSGRVDVADAARFTGNFVAETVEAGRLARWMAPESAAGLGDVLAKSRGKFSIRSAIEWSQTGLALEAIDGIADGSPFAGSVAAEFGEERATVRSDLAFDLVDLDRYLPADARPADLLAMMTGAAGANRTGADLAIDARAKRVSWLGREAEGVEIAIIAGEEGIDVVGFNINSFAGASIAAEGHVAPSPIGPLGAAQVSLRAENLEPLFNFLEIDVPDILGARPSLRDVDLIVAIESESGKEGGLATLSATGDVSASAVDLSVTSDAPLATFMDGALLLSVQVEASDALAIVGPAGLVPMARAGAGVAASAGRLAVTASGRLADNVHVAVVAEGFGGVLEAGGDIAAGGEGEGTATVRADRLGAIAAALGLEVSAEAADAPVDLSAAFTRAEGTLAVHVERGEFAGTAVSGTAKLIAGEPRRLELDIDTPLMSVPWLAGALFASGAASGGGADAGAVLGSHWPTDLIDVRALDGLDLDARARADRLLLGGASALSDAQVAFRIAGGKMHVERLEGRLGEGTIAVSGTVAGADNALEIEGRLQASEVSLARLVSDGKRRGLVTGLMNLESGFKARGRSLLSLVASLEGSGTFAVADTELPRFDAGALYELTDIEGSAEVYDATLTVGRLGETPLEPVSGKFEAANGRLKFGPVKLAGDGLRGEATSFVDLPSRRLDQELVLERPGGEGLRIEIVHAGAFGDIAREVELTDVPEIGQVRWREPLDSLALPEPEPEPVQVAPSLKGAVEGAPAHTATNAPRAPELPPVGLIDQQIIDLPILEESVPAQKNDGSG